MLVGWCLKLSNERGNTDEKRPMFRCLQRTFFSLWNFYQFFFLFRGINKANIKKKIQSEWLAFLLITLSFLCQLYVTLNDKPKMNIYNIIYVIIIKCWSIQIARFDYVLFIFILLWFSGMCYHHPSHHSMWLLRMCVNWKP